jgi:hypothetical protein
MNSKPSNPLVRQFAMTILFIVMVGSGISLSIALAGNQTLSFQVCGGFGVFSLVVLVLGALLVGRAR